MQSVVFKLFLFEKNNQVTRAEGNRIEADLISRFKFTEGLKQSCVQRSAVQCSTLN